jgi:alpha-1,6-mannosyltransferase
MSPIIFIARPSPLPVRAAPRRSRRKNISPRSNEFPLPSPQRFAATWRSPPLTLVIVKVCDLTQFYSPASGGVRRYLSEKTRFIREETDADEHVLIVPGEKDAVIEEPRARRHIIQSPLISRTSRYRLLLRLEAVERVLEAEHPDIIESGDPYQLAWKAVHSGAALSIPVVGFYHSHFPEAYLRTLQKFLGTTATEFFIDFARRYVRSLYNRFERTLVPSPALGRLLIGWGVRNVAHTDLGVDTTVFHPSSNGGIGVRDEFAIPETRRLLLYVGRLAHEKNTQTLFAAFRILPREQYHLIVVGDGTQRSALEQLRRETGAVSWIPACADNEALARLYRSADLFVHPGVQETFGLVALEAQACGTAVVGIRGSYMDRLIQSDQTHWALHNSPEALATAIKQTLADTPAADRKLLHTKIARQFGWSDVFRRLFDVYRNVITEFQRRGGSSPWSSAASSFYA